MTQPDTLAAVQAFVAAVAQVRVAEGWRFEKIKVQTRPSNEYQAESFSARATWFGPYGKLNYIIASAQDGISAGVWGSGGDNIGPYDLREVPFAELAQAVEAMMGTEVEK